MLHCSVDVVDQVDVAGVWDLICGKTAVWDGNFVNDAWIMKEITKKEEEEEGEDDGTEEEECWE